MRWCDLVSAQESVTTRQCVDISNANVVGQDTTISVGEVYNQLLLCLERAGNECSNLVEHGAELSMWGDALGADRPGSHDGGAPPVAKRSEAPVDELAEALA